MGDPAPARLPERMGGLIATGFGDVKGPEH
jgi:hypothetical protein